MHIVIYINNIYLCNMYYVHIREYVLVVQLGIWESEAHSLFVFEFTTPVKMQKVRVDM